MRVDTPLGRILIEVKADAVARLGWDDGPAADAEAPDHPLLHFAGAQVEDYFAGRRRAFDLPMAPVGSPFQRRVWRAVADIPWGAALSYGELARRIGCGSPRAVGQACGANPIMLLIPCHRVVAAGGRLGGYSGAEHIKTWLLRHEGVPVTP